MTPLLSLFFGLLLLYLGGEFLINSSISISKKLNLSKVLVGSIIAGFGTSMPELTVSVNAMLKNSPDIAIGNVIGSNIANTLFVIGISAIIYPIKYSIKKVRRDNIMMIIATLILSFFAFNGIIDYISGILMISLVIIYIFYSLYKNAGENNSDEINNLPSGNKNNFRLKKLQKNIKEVGVGKNIRLLLDSVSNLSINKSIFFIIFGIFLLIFGSNNFLSGAISIAEIYNIPQEIIGLGIVAFGSSLPELTTAIVASLKKQGSLIIGNIIGSNIFNILSIIGVISIIDDIILPLHISKFDIWTLLVITIFFSLILKYKNHISKKMGALFIVSYLCYIIHIF